MERVISRIAPTVTRLPKRKRVAAYARVSSEKDAMHLSLSNQVSYYSAFIQKNPEWQYAGVYADDGFTGTKEDRPEFQRLLAECQAGNIDLIVTKSISRFSRNTLTTLALLRQLKEIGVDVFFEKENIYTLDSKGELLITIMSSLAQEESRSISENVAWGKRAKCEEGRVYLPYKQFLGYRKGENGMPEIVESEAETVRLIYRLFLEGLMPSGIAKELTRRGILTPAGKQNWQDSTVRSILTNEKYRGDALLQKTFCVDFLTKRMKRNEGELPQFYVQNSHPAIIHPEVFEEVQFELKRRLNAGYTGKGGCFSSRIVCGECGAYFGRKVWHSNDEYRTIIWRCQHKYASDTPCKVPHVTEDQVKAAFVTAMNRILTDKAPMLTDIRALAKRLTDTASLDTEESSLISECEVVAEMQQKLITENARTALDQDECAKRRDALTARYNAAAQQLSELAALRAERRARKKELDKFLRWLSKAEPLTAFDEGLWNITVESVTVQADGKMRFRLRDGSVVE